MGSLYHLGQKLVDFANIITKHANRNDTVPSSSLVYKGAKNIATIEDSNVASQAYSVGNFLILDGQLYRVTNAIASGGTITAGTNVTLDSVGSEIKSLNDSLNNLFTDYSMSQNITVAANGSNYISIPISSAPSGTRFFVPFYLASGNNNVLLQQFSIDGSGTFTVYFRNISSQSVTSMATVRIRCIKIS